jgi:hypothetical protein
MSGENRFAIKYWPEDERPRERLIKYGSSTMSDAHLLGILIGSGDRDQKKCGGFEPGFAQRIWHSGKSRPGNSHRNVSDKRHWRGQGGINQSRAGGGKAHGFKTYRSEDQIKIQSGFCRTIFSFSEKSEKRNCENRAPGPQTTTH